ncbi:MAG: hypothetical protein PVJ49_09330 [Acidobacteriota bacterium]|jgi:hypothetical protein
MKCANDSPGAAVVRTTVLTLVATLIGVCALCPPRRAEAESSADARPASVVMASAAPGTPGCAVAIVDADNRVPDNDGFDSPAPTAAHPLAPEKEAAAGTPVDAPMNPAPTSAPPPLAIPLLC